VKTFHAIVVLLMVSVSETASSAPGEPPESAYTTRLRSPVPEVIRTRNCPVASVPLADAVAGDTTVLLPDDEVVVVPVVVFPRVVIDYTNCARRICNFPDRSSPEIIVAT
jgi:hypothetical protein